MVGNNSGRTALIGPKVMPINNIPMARNTSMRALPMPSWFSITPNVSPKTMMHPVMVSSVMRRPKRSASHPDTGTAAAKNRTAIS